MDFEGFTFTPPGAKEELTPEQKKERALAMLDKPLDEVIREERAARAAAGETNGRKKKTHKPKPKPKIITLQLSEREVERYVRQFSDIDLSGCNVRLQMVMTRDTHR